MIAVISASTVLIYYDINTVAPSCMVVNPENLPDIHRLGTYPFSNYSPLLNKSFHHNTFSFLAKYNLGKSQFRSLFFPNRLLHNNDHILQMMTYRALIDFFYF